MKKAIRLFADPTGNALYIAIEQMRIEYTNSSAEYMSSDSSDKGLIMMPKRRKEDVMYIMAVKYSAMLYFLAPTEKYTIGIASKAGM